MEIYGYPSLRGVSGEEIRRAVARAWEEITLQQEEEPIDVKLTPEEETRKRDLLSKMLPKAAPKPPKGGPFSTTRRRRPPDGPMGMSWAAGTWRRCFPDRWRPAPTAMLWTAIPW